jgi:hypothetical protein
LEKTQSAPRNKKSTQNGLLRKGEGAGAAEQERSAKSARIQVDSIYRGGIEEKSQQTPIKKKESGFDGCQHKLCRVHVNFRYDAVLEFLGFAKHVLDDYVAALGFGVNYIFKLGFPIDDNVEFTHFVSPKIIDQKLGYKRFALRFPMFCWDK